MNTRLVIAGSNIVLISGLVAIYGLATGDSELIGLSLSFGMIGATVIVYGTGYGELGPEFLLQYLKTLVESATVVLETLDLLDGNICGIVDSNGNILVVFSKSTASCKQSVGPGLGFSGGSPYYAIPVSTLPEIQSAEELDSKVVEDTLSNVLVSELSVCKSVKVNIAGEVVEVYIAGISELVRELANYPLEPIALLTTALLTKITRRPVAIVEKTSIPGGAKLVLRVM